MKKIFAFLLFLIAGLAYSQEVLVPFRVGDKFGLSDLKGKMKLEAKYEFINPEKDSYFTFKNKETSGLILAGKEVLALPGEYRFDLIKDKLIIASSKIYVKDDRGRQRKEEKMSFFTIKGKPLIDKDYKDAHFIQAFGGKTREDQILFVFSVLFTDDTQSLYVFDADKQKVTQKLFEKSAAIKVTGRDPFSSQVHIAVTAANGGTENHIIDYQKGNIAVLPATAIKERPTPPKRKAEKEIAEVSINSENGTWDPPAPDMPIGESAPQKMNNYNTMLTLEGKTVTATYKGYYSKKEITTKKIELPANSTDIVRGNWLQTFRSPGKSHNVYNYVTYSVNGKKGLFITDTLHIVPKYDELKLVKFKNGNSDLPAIIVGNKDAGGVMKYGIINEKGETLIPIQYEKIDYLEDETYSRGKSVKTLEDNLLVKRGGLYGIINYKKVEILPIKYTDIIRRSNSYATTYTLRNGDKYGILKYEMNKKTEFADALFPYPATFVLKDYAGNKGIEMVLLEKDDKIFCYARPDGFVYYKP